MGPAKRDPLKERVRRLVGTTRTARLVTAATVGAIVVAIAAFVALRPGGKEDEQSPLLRQIDQSCVAEKERISALEREALAQRPPDVTEFASVLVTIVAEWRANLRRDTAAAVATAPVSALSSVLLDILIEAGALARMVREGESPETIAAQAAAVDRSTARADRVIETLGLSECARLTVGPRIDSGP